MDRAELSNMGVCVCVSLLPHFRMSFLVFFCFFAGFDFSLTGTMPRAGIRCLSFVLSCAVMRERSNTAAIDVAPLINARGCLVPGPRGLGMRLTHVVLSFLVHVVSG